MSDKEFIEKQIENFSKPFSAEEFLEVAEAENSLVILEIPFRDYVLTDIARLIESNNAHVLQLSVLPVSGGTALLVSIKLDISDPTAVLRSFERFNYHVVYSYMKEGEINETQTKRLKELMYYLEM